MSSGNKPGLIGWLGGGLFFLLLLIWPATEIYSGFRNNDTTAIVFYTLLFAAILCVILAIILTNVSKTIRRWLVVPVPLLAGSIMVGIMALAVDSRPTLDNETWQTLRSACNYENILSYRSGGASGPTFYSSVPGTTPYDDSIPGIHPIFFVTPEERINIIEARDIPVEWSPTSLLDVELILCTTDNLIVNLGYCEYIGAMSLEKYGYVRAAWLVEASTGNLVSFREFKGTTKCPGSISPSRTSPVYGDVVSINAIINWAREYVERL